MSTTTQRGQIDPATYTMLERLATATATATAQAQCTERATATHRTPAHRLRRTGT
jgi:hypothetical protein